MNWKIAVPLGLFRISFMSFLKENINGIAFLSLRCDNETGDSVTGKLFSAGTYSVHWG